MEGLEIVKWNVYRVNENSEYLADKRTERGLFLTHTHTHIHDPHREGEMRMMRRRI